MKAKKPLEKGDRVRVFGWVNMHHSPYKPRAGGKATVTYYEDENHAHVKFDDEETHYTAHPRQCRRLLRKKKAAGKERWTGETTAFTGGNPAKWRKFKIVELRNGEAVISRADLAKAWDSVSAKNHGVSSCFNDLAAALGLEGSAP